MKPLNFIEPNSSTSLPSLKVWKRTSFYLCLTVFGILLSIEARQLYALYTVQQEHTALAAHNANQKRIQPNKQKLKNTPRKSAAIMPHRFIEAISSVIPDYVMVSNMLSDEKKQILTVKGQALNSQGITQFLRALGSHSLFKKVTLTHLLKDAQHLYTIYELEINY